MTDAQKELRKQYRRQTFRRQLPEMCGTECVCCGSDENIEYHHIVPIFQGGDNRFSNIVPLCYRCHKAAHNGRHMTKYADKSNTGGRPSKVSDEIAYGVFDRFVSGCIGHSDAKKELNMGKASKIPDMAQFKRYKKLHGIEKLRNNIDLHTSYFFPLMQGDECGWILYTDGRKETMYYRGA